MHKQLDLPWLGLSAIRLKVNLRTGVLVFENLMAASWTVVLKAKGFDQRDEVLIPYVVELSGGDPPEQSTLVQKAVAL